MTIYAEFQVVCECGDILLMPTESPSEAMSAYLNGFIAEPGHRLKVQRRMVQVSDWETTSPKVRNTPDTWLYKRPKGDIIHRAGCSRVPAARLPHWIWADTETDATVLRWVHAGFYKICTRCKPLEGTV